MALHETGGSVSVPARCAVCYVVDTRIRAGIESSSGEPKAAGAVTEPQHEERPHLPGPSLYPIAFAAGVACILVGLIVNPKVIAPIGAVIAIVFGFLWARDATKDYRGAPEPIEPERREPAVPDAPAIPANVGEAAMPEPEPGERFPRSRFLEASTLGLGAVIGGVDTGAVAGFAVLPAFLGQKPHEVDLGPVTDLAEGQWYIATFMTDPKE